MNSKEEIIEDLAALILYARKNQLAKTSELVEMGYKNLSEKGLVFTPEDMCGFAEWTQEEGYVFDVFKEKWKWFRRIKTFTTSELLAEYTKQKEMKKRDFKCEKCGTGFNTLNGLEWHITQDCKHLKQKER